MLSRRPVAASPSAEARRPDTRALASAGSGARERAALFAGGMAPRASDASSAGTSTSRSVPGAPGTRPAPAPPPVPRGPAEAHGPTPAPGFHGAVTEFKRRLIETTLTELGGNRTRAARALGLQRTYLLRLMRDFAVHVPAGPVPPRRAAAPTVTGPTPPR